MKTGAFEISGKSKKLSGKLPAVCRVHDLRTGEKLTPACTSGSERVRGFLWLCVFYSSRPGTCGSEAKLSASCASVGMKSLISPLWNFSYATMSK